MVAVLVVIIVGTLAICACFGAVYARRKGRSEWEGGALGLFFGPLGIVMALLLPEPTSPHVATRGHLDRDNTNADDAARSIEERPDDARRNIGRGHSVPALIDLRLAQEAARST